MEIAIIMGAGPAGLTAAYELLTKTNIKPVIIEADTQVGGISKTINYNGNLIDIGGHRFFSKSKKIIDWWLHFLPLENLGHVSDIEINYQNKKANFKVNDATEAESAGKMLLRPRKSRIYYQQHFFDYPLQLNKQTLVNLGFKKIFKICLSYANARLFPVKPEANLAQFFRNRFGKEMFETFFKDYTEKVWGVPCEAIPSHWGSQRIKSLNIGKAVLHALRSIFTSNKSLTQKGTSTSLIEQFLYPQKGPGQMWETVASAIIKLGGEIHLSAKINRLNADSSKIISANYTDLNTGKTHDITGDYFFSSIPVKELVLNMHNVAMEPGISAIAKGLIYRDFIIVGLLLKKMTERNQQAGEELTDNWIYLQDADIKAGRVQFFNNWSPHMVKDSDTTWMGVEYFCNDTDEFWNESNECIAKKAVEEMAKIGLINKNDLIDTTVIKVPKAYPSYAGTYKDFNLLQDYLSGFENLFPIGRNGMHRYNNSDHSMMTAMVAVENIVNGRSDKSNIWAVNLEDDYHEAD